MISALALLGPRAHLNDSRNFADDRVTLTTLDSPTPEEVRKTLDERNPSVILIFGGDGTINLHLSLLVEGQIPVLIIPTGSGNDLARATGSTTLREALGLWKKFLDGSATITSIDLGRIDSPSLRQSRYFSCCANIGMDAAAARITNMFPDWVKSHGGYFLGGLAALLSYRPQNMRIAAGEIAINERVWFISISNTPTFGGGLKIAPSARIDDGQLDVTLVPAPNLTRAALAFHLPKIFSGRHTRLSQLKMFQTTHLSIDTQSPQPIFADGEYIAQTPCDISVTPSCLKFVSA